MEAVARFAAEGGPVLGICNGFQISARPGCCPACCARTASSSSSAGTYRAGRACGHAFTSRCEAGQELVIPVKHGEGCWFAPPDVLAQLEANGQVVLRYAEDVNGSLDLVAGVLNAEETCSGLCRTRARRGFLLDSADGALILASLVDAARERLFAAA